MTTEKRIRPRVDFTIKVVFQTDIINLQNEQCENISMSGLLLRTATLLPLETEGLLQIVLECGEDRLEVRSKSKVVRVVNDENGKTVGVGLEFIDLDSDSSLNLYNVIKYQGGTFHQDTGE